ncbi:MAG TPA: tripartite tricarboxylate transporter TctB family protein [Usitatibacter sp.]|nr:tripartite tricarboxylate transporter TctB family protein [Usitatibacter sp.]
MQQQSNERSMGSVRLWEMVVALLFLVFGAGVMWDSWRIGARWGDDGPQAGYFPFYVGLLIVISAVFILYAAARMKSEEADEPFVRWGQLKMVLIVFIPTIIFVFLIDNPWYGFGIYEPSVVFIAVFMRYLGKYRWPMIAAVSIGIIFVFFLMFEIWFQVPLPKGPIEAALGYS